MALEWIHPSRSPEANPRSGLGAGFVQRVWEPEESLLAPPPVPHSRILPIPPRASLSALWSGAKLQ